MATLNELVTALSFKVDSKSFQNMAKMTTGVSMLQDGLESIGKIAGRGRSFMDILFGTAQEGQKLYNIASKLGMAPESIQKWQFAMKKLVGGSEEDATSLLSKMKEWGKTEEEMLQFADEIANAPSDVQYQWLRYFSQNELELLKKGSKELMKAFGEIEPFMLDENQVERLKKLNQELNKTQELFGTSVKKAMADNFLPAAEKVSKWFEEFLKDSDNREMMIDGLTVSLMALGGAGVVKGLKLVASAVKDVVGAVTFLGKAVPIAVGAYLIFDSIKTMYDYFQDPEGFEKRIDEMYKKMTGIEEIFNRIIHPFRNLIDMHANVEKNGGFLGTWDKIVASKNKSGGWGSFVYDVFTKSPNDVQGSAKGGLSFDEKDDIEKLLDKVQEKVNEYIDKNEDEILRNYGVTEETASDDVIKKISEDLFDKFMHEELANQDNSQTQYNTINVYVQGDSSKGVVENSESGIKRALQIAHPAKVDSIEPAVNVQ